MIYFYNTIGFTQIIFHTLVSHPHYLLNQLLLFHSTISSWKEAFRAFPFLVAAWTDRHLLPKILWLKFSIILMKSKQTFILKCITTYKYKIYTHHSTWLAATSISNGLFVAGFTLRYFSYFNLYIFFTFFCFSPFSDAPLGSRVFLPACRCLLCRPRSLRYKWCLG